MLLLLVTIIAVGLVTFVGCGGKDISGTYVSEKDSSEYLELRSDGTYFQHEMSNAYQQLIEIEGTYTISGNTLILTAVEVIKGPEAIRGEFATAEIEGNALDDSDGDKWFKQ